MQKGGTRKSGTKRHNLAHTFRYIELSITKRQLDDRVRCPEGDSDLDGGTCSVFPYLFTRTTGCLAREHQQLISEVVEAFYLKQGSTNRYVEVRFDYIIAYKLDDNDEKGRLQDIPAGTRICPYVGEVYTK